MKVSIITVCKNAADTIETTIKSIMNQTYKKVEFIIIDGDSNDGTKEVIEKYRDEISYYVSEPDRGIFHAMNKGIEASTGDILYFLNANDILYDEFVLEKVVDEFNNFNADIIFGDIFLFCSNPNQNYIKIFEPNKIYRQNKFNSKFSFWENCLNHQSIFYRKKVFDKCGLYSEEYPMSGDYEFNVRAIVKHKFKPRYIPITIAKFDLGGYSTYNSVENIITSIQGKEQIREKYFISNFEFFVYNVLRKNLYKLCNKLFRSFLRKYDNDEEFKLKVNKVLLGFHGWETSRVK